MVRFEAGSGGAGNKLKVDINDVMKYKISILDIQKIITREGVPRYDRGQEKRVWIMCGNYPIVELGVEEIHYAMQVDKNKLSPFEQNTIIGIQDFINDYQKDIQLLLS